MADVTSTFAAKDVGFTSTVNRMQRSLAGFQNGIGAFAVKAAGLVTAFVGVQQSFAAFNKALSMGGQLDDLSKTTGASAGELLLLQKAFELAGSSADAVGPAIARLNRFMVEAKSGGTAQIETMNKLGLSYEQLKSLTPTDQMRLLAKSIMALPTPAERTAAAMDIFGRSGATLIPLFANFSGELDKAQGYLGSLPGLLDESAGAMADMEDDIGALGDKFNQFVAGLVAGVAGADNFASALAKIDTAGIGAGLGEQLRVAFDAPLETAKAIGYTLLTGVKQAGNNLMNAFSTAVSFFQNLFSDGEYWSGIGQRVQAMFMESVNAFNKLLLSAVEGALLKPLSSLPGILGDPFRAALETTQDIRASLESASEANAKNLAEGGAKIESAIERATANTEVITKDWFGVEQSAADAARHFLEAQQVSDEIRANSEKTAENFGKGSAVLRQALNDLRGFDLAPKAGPEQRPDWTRSTEPPPAPTPTPDAASNTGGGTSAPKPTSALDALRKAAETDARARADVFRIEAEKSRRTSRVPELMDKRFFSSAANIELRAERNAETRARDAMSRRFGVSEDFDRFVRDQQMTPTERARAEESRETEGQTPRQAALATEASLQQLIKEITERLPQDALVA
jgi:hypothetical protein